MNWLIWSNKHQAWLGAHACGYVNSVEIAGRYSFREALDICRSNGASACPETIMSPSPELIASIEQKMERVA